MRVTVSTTLARTILTRTSGYLRHVSSHSLQPYRGCSFGQSLCGVGCYVQHNRFITKGLPWGSFVVAKTNAAELYARDVENERAYANRHGREFGIFMSSSTDPFLPHEARFGITTAVLRAMLDAPPEFLILQTHTHLIVDAIDLIEALSRRTRLRVHLSIESDRASLPGMPAPPSPVSNRLQTAMTFRKRGIRTVVTVAPLLPIENPKNFFSRIRNCADTVILDHYIGGDGSSTGSRTLRTKLPEAMTQLLPASISLEYQDQMVSIARDIMPGRVGVGIDGFAGRLLD